MIITREESLWRFEFWSGAKKLADMLTEEELDELEVILEEQYPDGIDETELNDLFWHDGDTIAEWLGFEDEEAILHRYDENDEDEDEEDE